MVADPFPAPNGGAQRLGVRTARTLSPLAADSRSGLPKRPGGEKGGLSHTHCGGSRWENGTAHDVLVLSAWRGPTACGRGCPAVVPAPPLPPFPGP